MKALKKAELKLLRKWFTSTTTIGELYLNGIFLCYTLEDTNRGLQQSMPEDQIKQLKIWGKTCIPYGLFEVVMNYSAKFKTITPLLLKVIGYAGILMHWGNYAKDTEGCILVGLTKDTDFVGNSKEAFKRLMNELKKYDTISIEIIKDDAGDLRKTV